MKYCLIHENSEVSDVIDRDPFEIFHSEIASLFIQCPDYVKDGMYFDGENYYFLEN